MIKAITLDVDMTMIDFIDYKTHATNAAAHAMIKAGYKKSKKRLGKELFDFYMQHGIESDDVFGAFLKKNHQYDDRILAAGINAYLKSKYKHLKTYPGVKTTLKKLKAQGYKLAVITDAPKLKALVRLDEVGIADLFDVVIGFDDTGRMKPSRLMFKKALNELGVKPNEALHLGDYRERDVLGAKNMGMKTCIARYGDMKFGRRVWADYYLDDFRDLPKILAYEKKTENKK